MLSKTSINKFVVTTLFVFFSGTTLQAGIIRTVIGLPFGAIGLVTGLMAYEEYKRANDLTDPTGLKHKIKSDYSFFRHRLESWSAVNLQQEQEQAAREQIDKMVNFLEKYNDTLSWGIPAVVCVSLSAKLLFTRRCR